MIYNVNQIQGYPICLVSSLNEKKKQISLALANEFELWWHIMKLMVNASISAIRVCSLKSIPSTIKFEQFMEKSILWLRKTLEQEENKVQKK